MNRSDEGLRDVEKKKPLIFSMFASKKPTPSHSPQIDEEDVLQDNVANVEQGCADADLLDSLVPKLDTLREIILEHDFALVGFSGDAPSSLLAKTVAEVLPEDRRTFVLASGYLQPQKRREIAHACANTLGIPLQECVHEGFHKKAVRQNEALRCYRCRVGLFDTMLGAAPHSSTPSLMIGYTADKMGDIIRGRKAMKEYDVLTPLSSAGITSEECRIWAQQQQLPECEAPDCIAVHFEINTALDEDMAKDYELWDTQVRSETGCRTVASYIEDGLISIVLPYQFVEEHSRWRLKVSPETVLPSGEEESSLMAELDAIPCTKQDIDRMLQNVSKMIEDNSLDYYFLERQLELNPQVPAIEEADPSDHISLVSTSASQTESDALSPVGECQTAEENLPKAMADSVAEGAQEETALREAGNSAARADEDENTDQQANTDDDYAKPIDASTFPRERVLNLDFLRGIVNLVEEASRKDCTVRVETSHGRKARRSLEVKMLPAHFRRR